MELGLGTATAVILSQYKAALDELTSFVTERTRGKADAKAQSTATEGGA
jgi:hypothetical protein